MQFSKAICSVKSINSPGSLALVQGLGESGETAETDPESQSSTVTAASNTGATHPPADRWL